MVYEQFLYFWFLWVIVIIIAFFMQNRNKRSYLLIWTLLILLMSEQYVSLKTIHVSLTFSIFIIGSIILFAYHSFTIYTVLVTFSVMISYVALLIWDKITPVWFVMPTYFITPIMTVCLIVILVQSFYSQIAIALVGASFGQLIFELLLISYQLHDTIGEKVFFIHMSVTILLLIVLRCIHSILGFLKSNTKRKLV